MRLNARTKPISAKGFTVAAPRRNKIATSMPSLIGQTGKGLIFPIACFYVEMKLIMLTNYGGKDEGLRLACETCCSIERRLDDPKAIPRSNTGRGRGGRGIARRFVPV